MASSCATASGFRFRAFRAGGAAARRLPRRPAGRAAARSARRSGSWSAGSCSASRAAVRDASLVMPDAWLRVTFTESGDLPSAADARDEVLRWKLRRLVPFRVDELRVGATEVDAARRPGGAAAPAPRLRRRAAPRPARGGVRRRRRAPRPDHQRQPGAARRRSRRPRRPRTDARRALVAWSRSEGYTLVFARGGEPVLHR